MNADFYKLVRTLESLTEETPESKKLENGKSVLKESSITEMDKSQPSSDRGGESSGDPYAKGGKATPIKPKDMSKHALQVITKKMDIGRYGDGSTITDRNDPWKGVKEEQQSESALQAYLGKKKYGEEGMKALQQAGREGASKEKMAKIRAQHDKMDEQQGVAEGSKPTKKEYLKKLDQNRKDIEDTRKQGVYGAPGSLKNVDWVKKQGVAEGSVDSKYPHGEVKYRIVYRKSGERVEGVKSFDSKADAQQYASKDPQYSVQAYRVKQDVAEGSLNEKAVSTAQQKFMGMVHAAQKGDKPASPEVAKVAKTMSKKAAKDFAATKHKGLPKHVDEAEVWRPGMPPPPNPDMGSSLTPKEQQRITTPQGPGGVQQPILPSEPKKPAQPKRSDMGTDTDVAETAKAKDKKADRLPIYQESIRFKTINKLIREEFDLGNDNISLEEKDIKSALGDDLFNELQAVKNGESEMSEQLKDALFKYYQNTGELPPEVSRDEQDVTNYIKDRIMSMSSDSESEQSADRLPVSEDQKVKGTRYGGSAQVDDEETDDDTDTKKATAAEPKRGRGRPRKDSGDANTKAKYSGASELQSMIVGNVPKKSKDLGKLPTTKHKLKGE